MKIYYLVEKDSFCVISEKLELGDEVYYRFENHEGESVLINKNNYFKLVVNKYIVFVGEL